MGQHSGFFHPLCCVHASALHVSSPCTFTLQRFSLPLYRSAARTGGIVPWVDRTALSSPSSRPPTAAGKQHLVSPTPSELGGVHSHLWIMTGTDIRARGTDPKRLLFCCIVSSMLVHQLPIKKCQSNRESGPGAPEPRPGRLVKSYVHESRGQRRVSRRSRERYFTSCN